METRHLTYAELGEALSISAASAKRLAIRRGWPKQPGNDGKARVCVPAERLQVERKVMTPARPLVMPLVSSPMPSPATSPVSSKL